jgi:hypothetical protein
MLIPFKEYRAVLAKSKAATDTFKKTKQDITRALLKYDINYKIREDDFLLVKDFRPVQTQVKELTLFLTYALTQYSISRGDAVKTKIKPLHWFDLSNQELLSQGLKIQVQLSDKNGLIIISPFLVNKRGKPV